ncbi:MAG: hypothetical protein ACR2OE_01890 [Thermomicrobiales bacterium]
MADFDIFARNILKQWRIPARKLICVEDVSMGIDDAIEVLLGNKSGFSAAELGAVVGILTPHSFVDVECRQVALSKLDELNRGSTSASMGVFCNRAKKLLEKGRRICSQLSPLGRDEFTVSVCMDLLAEHVLSQIFTPKFLGDCFGSSGITPAHASNRKVATVEGLLASRRFKQLTEQVLKSTGSQPVAVRSMRRPRPTQEELLHRALSI